MTKNTNQELIKQINNLKTLCSSELNSQLICALTHNIPVCDDCSKCTSNAAVTRVELVHKIDEIFAAVESLSAAE